VAYGAAARPGALARLRSLLPRRGDDPMAASTALEAARAGHDDPRIPEVAALLADLDELRLMLAADLGIAASAVELGAFEIAGEAVDGSRQQLAAFSDRAKAHLGVAPASSPADDEPRPRDVVPLEPVRRAWRAGRRLATAGPAVAAAAIVGVLVGMVPAAPGTPASTPITPSAVASYAHLYRLHETGAPPHRLREAHRQLQAEVAQMLAVADRDPRAAEQALRLLELEAEVLGESEHRAELSDMRAGWERLVAALQAALGPTPAVARLEALAGAPERVVREPAPRPVEPPAVATVRRTERTEQRAPAAANPPAANSPAKEQTATEPSAQPAAENTASATPSAAASPSSAPPASREPEEPADDDPARPSQPTGFGPPFPPSLLES
jgi:hypothetical protein